MGNASKMRFLGMPFGTASGRLRKMILFSLLQKLAEDSCFKCGLKIETVGELSIEHKKPWEGISEELFWDLNNIAFSHVVCNRPHRPSEGLRKVGPDGTAWCIGCKTFHSTAEFTTDSGHWNGLDRKCRKRRNEAKRTNRILRKVNAPVA